MKWINFDEERPKDGQFIVAFRTPYPSMYWLGFYKEGYREEEDLFSYWMPLPNPPK